MRQPYAYHRVSFRTHEPTLWEEYKDGWRQEWFIMLVSHYMGGMLLWEAFKLMVRVAMGVPA